MNVVRYTTALSLPEECVATIGFFDGVHKGHRYLIRQVVEEAHRQGRSSMVITFDCHPRQIVKTDYRPQLLSTLEEKTALLATTGIDRCVVLHFDEHLASLSAQAFMADVLRKHLNVTTLIIGYDNRFGHNRADGFEAYVGYGREMGMAVKQAEPFVMEGVSVSSSVVRSLLKEGEVSMAARCLGYAYPVVGTVHSGEHIGTQIGFPTANIVADDPLKLIPANGVYATRVRMADGTTWKSMLNIGTRPTFGGNNTTIEAHLLDYSGNLYGQRLSVAFVERLRPERKFRNAAELVSQLKRDAEDVKKLLK